MQLSPNSTTKQPVGELQGGQLAQQSELAGTMWCACHSSLLVALLYPLRPAPGFWALLTSQVGVGRRELGLEPCLLYHP